MPISFRPVVSQPPNSLLPRGFPCVQSLPHQLRFQEIPQYTPEADTRARWKFNSPLPRKKSFKAAKCSEQVSQLPAPNTNGCCQSHLNRKQVCEEMKTPQSTDPPANPLCHQTGTADPAQISAGLKQKQLITTTLTRYQIFLLPWPHAWVQQVWKIPAFVFL